MPAMHPALLQVNSLSCERDDRLLFAGLNFTVQAGEVWQISGPNGSGKTSLLRILTGLADHYDGEILWQGVPLSRNRQAVNSEIQYLGHLPGIKQTLTAQENLRWYLSLYRQSLVDDKIDQALAQVGLSGFEDIPCGHLSAGQQRRVNLARLFLVPAKLWILDEPLTAIDKDGVAAIERHIAEFVQGGGAVIVTTHQTLNLPVTINALTLGPGGDHV